MPAVEPRPSKVLGCLTSWQQVVHKSQYVAAAAGLRASRAPRASGYSNSKVDLNVAENAQRQLRYQAY